MLALLDLVPASAPASASDWRVAALREHVYPGSVAADDTASGLLLVDLTDAEWHTLDAFENDLYSLHRLPLDDHRSSWAYVPHDETEVLAQDREAAAFVNGNSAPTSSDARSGGSRRPHNGEPDQRRLQPVNTAQPA